jgi:hypothetical protein
MLAKFQIKHGSRGVRYHTGENMSQAAFTFRNFACFINFDVHLLQTKTSAAELAIPPPNTNTIPYLAKYSYRKITNRKV